MLNSTKVLDGIRNGNYSENMHSTSKAADKITDVPTKSRKLKLESSPEQLEILSVKENNGQIMIEFRDPSNSVPSIAGIDDAKHNYQSTQDEFVIIKLEDNMDSKKGGKMDIKIEEEFELDVPSISVQSISKTDTRQHTNQTIKDEYARIKVEHQMDIKIEHENQIPSVFVQNEKLCNEVQMDPLNTMDTKISDLPDELEEYKDLYKHNKTKTYAHRLFIGKPNFQCSVCGAPKYTQMALNMHMRTHLKKINLITHMKIHNDSGYYFTCELCLQKFVTEVSFKFHQKKYHRKS